MITTKDVNLKETKDEKLTMLTTGGVKPIEFVVKGQASPVDKRMVTTSNVDQFRRDLIKERKKYEAKAKAVTERAKKITAAIAKKAKVEAAAMEKKKNLTGTKDSGRDK